MPPTGFRNLSITTDANFAFKELHTTVVEHVGRALSVSEVIQIAADLVAHNASLIDGAASRVLDKVTVQELTRRLGLPEHEQGAVGAWTGTDWGTVWTEAEAAELVDIWNMTCTVHGIHACRAAECWTAWGKPSN